MHAEQAAPAPRRPGQAAPEPRRPGQAAPEPPAVARPDAQEVAQQFVARLRAAARDFAAAAGAETAVVREAVPPARHRRSRCRVVLRDAGGAETDLIFVGPADRAGPGEQPRFEVAIQRWLGSGRPRRDAWVLRDPDAPDGVAIDVSAWLAAS